MNLKKYKKAITAAVVLTVTVVGPLGLDVGDVSGLDAEDTATMVLNLLGTVLAVFGVYQVENEEN